ncbi:chemotaxis protein CheB [Sediminibacterium sp.]|jgi:two-component system, chemotaxis family, protein-glutamate methylesterase/glutaminase|uniref:chemotaxis protein CheB n=1 Tax=Sediminibacterium sp. TaxID=1917865 RepID=UPI0025E0755C|nr:chemotaxis protein CheB [Sediminibacterium sp.]MBW0177586.1 chemotaxis protein CheB [Sediminibacterium sp.]
MVLKEQAYDIILIGGSAGSIPVCVSLLKALKKDQPVPVVLIIHRMRNVVSELDKLLSKETGIKKITEPEDKQSISSGKVYLAPQNYHLLFEEDASFSLDYSDPIHYSRPSIDVSFESAALVYGTKVLAILLSGANADGAKGLSLLAELGADCWVQDPATAEYPAMPSAAMALSDKLKVLTEDQMKERLHEL